MALNWLNDMPILSGINDLAAGRRGGDVDWSGKHIEGRNVGRQAANAVATGGGLIRPMTDYDLSKTFTISDRVGQKDILPGGTRKMGETVKAPSYDFGDMQTLQTGLDDGTGGLIQDPAYAAMMAQQAADADEARELREGILGRRGEVQSILDAILGNIDTELREAKSRRTGQFDRDVDSLVGALDEAIPDIQNAFAAMGLSNSTYKGDRVQDTRDSYGKSYEDTNRQLNEDLTGFKRKAASEEAKAETNANKMFGALDEVKGMEANADNLGQLKRFNSDTRNALTDFEGQKSRFMPGGDALRAISELDSDYDFGKTLDTFNTFASDKASPTGSGVGGGKSKVGQIYEDDKKKKKTEVQVNNPVGAASA